MSERIEIPFNQFNLNAVDLWSKGLVLTAGINEPGKFNPMTIGFGSIGWMWHKPMILVVVRPTRYTFHLIEEYPTFTVCAFSTQYKEVITLFGKKSGRDMDKFKESGLTLQPSTEIQTPGYAEAELIFECRKSYVDDIKPDHFLPEYAQHVEKFYPRRDFHRVYYGEILKIYGDAKYLRNN